VSSSRSWSPVTIGGFLNLWAVRGGLRVGGLGLFDLDDTEDVDVVRAILMNDQVAAAWRLRHGAPKPTDATPRAN
jgi:hypothetical protein